MTGFVPTSSFDLKLAGIVANGNAALKEGGSYRAYVCNSLHDDDTPTIRDVAGRYAAEAFEETNAIVFSPAAFRG